MISRMVFRWAKYMSIGGIVFWVTDAGFSPLRGLMPMRLLIVAKTLLLPALIVVTVRAVTRKPMVACSPTAKSFLLLAGIWLMGAVDLVITSLATGNIRISMGEAIFHLALFPLATIIMALYSGALGGLLIATVVLCLFPFFSPPSGKAPP